MSNRLEDYALVGDMQTAALVSREGSIDWLCLPRFDSDACFAALLGDGAPERNGRWSICPRGGARNARRRYRTDTLILETELDGDEGTIRIADCMPPRDRDPDLVREVECVRGRVEIDFALAKGPKLEVVAAGIVGEKSPEADLVVTPWPSDHRATYAKVKF